jgi:phosphocarrier protein HPr
MVSNSSENSMESVSNNTRLERKVRILNKLGMHARPAALFVQTANQFEADISVRKGKQTVNGKSIMGLMMLAAGPNTQIVLIAEGRDAEEALNALERLFLNKFGEE